MSTPQQTIDSYLGNGWYKEWQDMDSQAKREGLKVDKNWSRYPVFTAPPIFSWLTTDFAFLEKIGKDYKQGMTLVGAGRRVSKDQIEEVHDLYSLALSLAQNQNDVLEGMWECGFAAAFLAFPWVVLQTQAAAVLDVLKELSKELEEAEREMKNAVKKARIHAAIIFFEAMTAEISVPARAALFVFDWVADRALGPDHPTTGQKVKAIATPGVKQFAETVHHIKAYGSTARSVAEGAGGIATAATFYFDWEECTDIKARVNRLKTVSEKGHRAYESLVKLIEENEAGLKVFAKTYHKWMKRLAEIRREGDTLRNMINTDMSAYGFSRTSAVVWRVAP